MMSQSNAQRKTEARAVSGLLDEQIVLLLTLIQELILGDEIHVRVSFNLPAVSFPLGRT